MAVNGIEDAPAPRKRYDYMDLIKFIAMLFVIMYHASNIGVDFYDFIDAPSVLHYLNYLVRPILATCVPLFFFANGFLLISKPLDIKAHVLKCIRLIVLTGIWAVINLLLMMPIREEWFSLREFISAIWNWKQGWINHLWFMGALICIYIFFPLIKSAFDSSKKVFNYWMIVCFFLTFGNSLLNMAVNIVSLYFFNLKECVPFNMLNIFNPLRGTHPHAFSYFLLGCFIRGNPDAIHKMLDRGRFINKISLSAVLIFSTLLLGLWGFLITARNLGIWDVVWFNYDSVFTLINVIVIYLLSMNYQCPSAGTGHKCREGIGRYIRLVGSNTLGIYFMHMVFLHLFDRWSIMQLPFMENYLSLGLYAFIVMSLCLLISVLLKKIPIINKLLN